MEMSKTLVPELLQKVNNPSHMFSDLEVDEDGAAPNVPQRIASRHTARAKRRLPSQLGAGIAEGGGIQQPSSSSSWATKPIAGRWSPFSK